MVLDLLTRVRISGNNSDQGPNGYFHNRPINILQKSVTNRRHRTFTVLELVVLEVRITVLSCIDVSVGKLLLSVNNVEVVVPYFPFRSNYPVDYFNLHSSVKVVVVSVNKGISSLGKDTAIIINVALPSILTVIILVVSNVVFEVTLVITVLIDNTVKNRRTIVRKV